MDYKAGRDDACQLPHHLAPEENKHTFVQSTHPFISGGSITEIHTKSHQQAYSGGNLKTKDKEEYNKMAKYKEGCGSCCLIRLRSKYQERHRDGMGKYNGETDRNMISILCSSFIYLGESIQLSRII